MISGSDKVVRAGTFVRSGLADEAVLGELLLPCGPDKFDADTTGFSQHHVPAWASAERLRHKFDLDSRPGLHLFGNFQQLFFA